MQHQTGNSVFTLTRCVESFQDGLLILVCPAASLLDRCPPLLHRLGKRIELDYIHIYIYL